MKHDDIRMWKAKADALQKELAAKDRKLEIEAALEEVRSRSLAMHKSNELKEVVAVVFEKLDELSFLVNDGAAIILIFIEGSKDHIEWIADPTQSYSMSFKIPYSHHSMSSDLVDAKESGAEFFSKLYSFEEKNAYFNYLFQHTDYKHLSDDVKKVILESEHMGFSVAFQKHSAILIPTNIGKLLTSDQQEILKRFTKVFEQAYTRFHDLQKAEALARESYIEASLERVRSRTMAMQKSEELFEVIKVIYGQLSNLGFGMSQVGFGMDYKESNDMNLWVADAYQDFMVKLHIPYTALPLFNSFISAKEKGLGFYTTLLSFEEKNEWYDHVFKHVPASDETKTAVYACPGMAASNVLLKEVALYAFNYAGIPYSNDENTVLVRFGNVFEQTYVRFLDLQKAEAHARQAEQDLIEIKAARKKAEDALSELQVTQRQLIQSEKMASLGELTAGIAHEIQNPLNFVNNFSEVTTELIEELEQEADKGNTGQVKTIADDIRQNLEKINHHGKRADAIVKGMLQHSRKSSGQREPTDINALCDEYIRLCYHGLRAKDKSFNADIHTDFDTTIDKINVIPQDIGRAILNVITNAFYAVNKKKLLEENYQPLVSIQTQKLDNAIQIRIEDNGNGIPANILDKIFQPFFTTKPTGSGTGLGLSLAYDIITKEHNGKIQVESKEGEGSAFIIALSANLYL